MLATVPSCTCWIHVNRWLAFMSSCRDHAADRDQGSQLTDNEPTDFYAGLGYGPLADILCFPVLSLFR